MPSLTKILEKRDELKAEIAESSIKALKLDEQARKAWKKVKKLQVEFDAVNASLNKKED